MHANNPEIALGTFPVLHTERLDLIAIDQSHISDIYKLFGDEKVTRFYNILPLTNQMEAQKPIDWFQNRFNENLGIRWGIALKGMKGIIGTIGFNNFTRRHRANIGYDLQSEHWNNGYMSEALDAILYFGFHKLEINRIEAEVMSGNIASEKLLEKLNFKREGVLRQWLFWNNKYYDMIMFSLLADQYTK